MPQSSLRRRMRPEDAMFLYLERREMPLHIGSVNILDGPFPESGERLIEERLSEIPRYRQRAMFAPFNLVHPAWEFDPDFDIRCHLRRVQIDSPGTDEQLSELSGRIFTPLMDRNKPLWDLTIVDGLEGGRSALISRVHHCLVDGVSGTGLTSILLDTSPNPRRGRRQKFAPPALPGSARLLVEGLAMAWTEAAERAVDAQAKVLRIARAFVDQDGQDRLNTLLSIAPELLLPAARLPFNRPCSGIREHRWTAVPFSEGRAIRSALGGTVNDVVLSAVGGAVARYVEAHREPLAGRFVRIMVPVSLRTEDPCGDTGNQVSMLPLGIPLDIADPVQRLRTVTARTASLKSARVADLIALFATWAGFTPPLLQHSIGALPFLSPPSPWINLVCTNVPGPMIPLYAAGREVVTYYPHVPVGNDLGLGVAVLSYNQNLYFGITSDAQAVPDAALFRDLLLESWNGLRAAAGVAQQPAPPVPPRAPAQPPAGLRAHRKSAAAV
jgi:diacylglycerol O-acyltransferase